MIKNLCGNIQLIKSFQKRTTGRKKIRTYELNKSIFCKLIDLTQKKDEYLLFFNTELILKYYDNLIIPECKNEYDHLLDFKDDAEQENNKYEFGKRG
jgi:hypothetical protein